MSGIKKRVASRYSGKGGWIILLGMIPMALSSAYWLLECLGILPELLDFSDFPLYAALVLVLAAPLAAAISTQGAVTHAAGSIFAQDIFVVKFLLS